MRVPALVTLGQAALESGWGAHAPKFNFFGIKAKVFDPPERRQLVQTREVLSVPDHPFPEVISVTQRPDGKYLYVIRDWFRSFVSAEEAFKAHAELLSGNQRYARAFTMGLDAFAFAMEVARAGYATDPSYETTLAAIMRSVQSAGFP
jgi:flagellum-specific peptidoglycan hydrolase FlgJ